MIGRIIDINGSDSFVSFSDGTTRNVSILRLPRNSKVGDIVDLDCSTLNLITDTDRINNSLF